MARPSGTSETSTVAFSLRVRTSAAPAAGRRFGYERDGGGAVEWRFESAEQIYPSSLRGDIMALLHDRGAPDSDFGSAELIYGELISNVIRHARGKVSVRLDWNDDFPRLCVCDEQHFVAPTVRLPADPFAESGRGLFIVKALAREFTLGDAATAGSEACAILPVKRR